MSTPMADVSPLHFFETINAYQRTAALKGAIDLALFTAIGDGNQTISALADECQAQERGVRILCDYLELVAKLTFQMAMRDDGTSQCHQSFMRRACGLLAHPQLPELMQPRKRPLDDPSGFPQPAPMCRISFS